LDVQKLIFSLALTSTGTLLFLMLPRQHFGCQLSARARWFLVIVE
jgi:hypothetical protein